MREGLQRPPDLLGLRAAKVSSATEAMRRYAGMLKKFPEMARKLPAAAKQWTPSALGDKAAYAVGTVIPPAAVLGYGYHTIKTRRDSRASQQMGPPAY